MDIEDLQTFVAVADAGGVSAAARRLGVSKSIVSRRLFRIEAELGVQLLARTTRGAALTEAGNTFRDHAARASAEIDTARETILPSGELRGRLRVAMPLSFGPTHFAPVLAEMARLHPQLHIHTSYSDRFVDLIAEGFDCALINPRFIKPLDQGTTEFFARAADVLVTLEDHVIQGGYGSAVLEFLAEKRITTPVVRIGWPDQFIEHASSVQDLREKHGLTAASITAKVKAEFASAATARSERPALVTAVA